jgi:putative aldouronate transport system permease protein
MKGKFVASARHLGRSIWKNRACYSLMLPGIIWFILFAYGPMSGLLLAFKTYSARGGIWGSPWCGFENFAYVFKDAAFFRSVWTTLTINVGRLLFQFPVPIILALLINECKWKRFNKIAQTIFTFPYFLSWVIVASIVTNVLSLDGMVNSLLAMLNLDKTNFLGNSTLFIPLLYLTDSWKSAGWSAIIYLAALSGIDVDQYEAAELDGANRWQTLIRVTLPNLKPTILVMLVLEI